MDTPLNVLEKQAGVQESNILPDFEVNSAPIYQPDTNLHEEVLGTEVMPILQNTTPDDSEYFSATNISRKVREDLKNMQRPGLGVSKSASQVEMMLRYILHSQKGHSSLHEFPENMFENMTHRSIVGQALHRLAGDVMSLRILEEAGTINSSLPWSIESLSLFHEFPTNRSFQHTINSKISEISNHYCFTGEIYDQREIEIKMGARMNTLFDKINPSPSRPFLQNLPGYFDDRNKVLAILLADHIWDFCNGMTVSEIVEVQDYISINSANIYEALINLTTIIYSLDLQDIYTTEIRAAADGRNNIVIPAIRFEQLIAGSYFFPIRNYEPRFDFLKELVEKYALENLRIQIKAKPDLVIRRKDGHIDIYDFKLNARHINDRAGQMIPFLYMLNTASSIYNGKFAHIFHRESFVGLRRTNIFDPYLFEEIPLNYRFYYVGLMNKEIIEVPAPSFPEIEELIQVMSWLMEVSFMYRNNLKSIFAANA